MPIKIGEDISVGILSDWRYSATRCDGSSNQYSCIMVHHGGVRKGMGLQMLVYHKSMQLLIQKKVSSRFLIKYQSVSNEYKLFFLLYMSYNYHQCFLDETFLMCTLIFIQQKISGLDS